MFRGTRVPARSLFDHLASGDSIEAFLEGFRSVRREQVIGLLAVLKAEISATAARCASCSTRTSTVASSHAAFSNGGVQRFPTTHNPAVRET